MPINQRNFQDISHYEIKTYLSSYEVLNSLLSSPDSTITRSEIESILETDINSPQKSRDKLIERHNEKFRIIFNFSKTEYYFDRSLKAYKLSIDNVSKLESHKVLYSFLHAAVIANNLSNEDKKLSKAFVQESEFTYQNITIVFKLIEAINKKKTISFKHINLYSGEENYHEMEPWFIKHFENKFYLIGLRTKRNDKAVKEYRHFDMSQIIGDSVVITKNSIDEEYKNSEFPTIEYQIFDQCIGVMINKVEDASQFCIKDDLIIETDFALGITWKKNPIHFKQECVQEAKSKQEKFQFKFPDFYFNVTFKKLLLRHWENSVLISPGEAIEEFKKDLEINLKKY